ncbi:MAG: caspase family protein [Spirochaetia bacterium]|nr:caspase family protein [Spirochaetia bacterium]
MKPFFFFFLPLIILTVCSAPTIEGKTYALIYGVSDYSDYASALRLNAANLKACQNDARSLATALESVYGSSAIIRLRIEPIYGGTATKERPTKQQILTDFATIAAEADTGDRFLFFYAGHGIAMNADEVDPNDRGEYGETAVTYRKREYLCPAVGNSTEPVALREVLLSDKELREALLSLPCRKKFVLLDCCHSAGMISAYPDVNASVLHAFSNSAMTMALRAYNAESESEKEAHKNTWILAAAGETGNSYESSDIGNHGFFTYGLLKGFGEADFNRDGFVSWSELSAYTADYSQLMLKEIDPFGNAAEFGDMLVTCGSGPEDILFAPVTRLDDSVF